MEPIVSPWLIYGIEMLRYANTVVVIGFIISVIALLFTVGFLYSEETSDDDRALTRRNIWKPLVVVVILMLISVLLPSRETAYKMLMASYVTPNTIHAVGTEANEAVGALLDNITNHMKELKDNK